MPVFPGVAVARRIHHPAEEHGQQDEQNETHDQRPEHAHKIYEAGATAPRLAPEWSLLGVEGLLFTGRRERPRDLEPAFLAEHEPKLAGRTQPIGMGRTKGRTRTGLRYRAEEILLEVAALAACLCGSGASCGHA